MKIATTRKYVTSTSRTYHCSKRGLITLLVSDCVSRTWTRVSMFLRSLCTTPILFAMLVRGFYQILIIGEWRLSLRSVPLRRNITPNFPIFFLSGLTVLIQICIMTTVYTRVFLFYLQGAQLLFIHGGKK